MGRIIVCPICQTENRQRLWCSNCGFVFSEEMAGLKYQYSKAERQAIEKHLQKPSLHKLVDEQSKGGKVWKLQGI